MNLEERLERLEGLFEFGEAGVSLCLKNKDSGFGVKLGSTSDGGELLIEGPNHVLSLRANEHFAGTATFFRPTIDQGATQAFIVDNNGIPFVQAMEPGSKIFLTPLGLVVQSFSELASPEPEPEKPPEGTTIKPKG